MQNTMRYSIFIPYSCDTSMVVLYYSRILGSQYVLGQKHSRKNMMFNIKQYVEMQCEFNGKSKLHHK